MLRVVHDNPVLPGAHLKLVVWGLIITFATLLNGPASGCRISDICEAVKAIMVRRKHDLPPVKA